MAKKKNTLMWALYALFFLCAALLQDTVLGKFSFFGAGLCIAPMAAVCVAIQTGAEKGGLFCLAAGLALALSGTSDGGLWLFFLTLTGSFCGWLCATVFHPRLVPTVLLSLLSLILSLTVVYLIHIYLEGLAFRSVFFLFRQVLPAIPFAPVFYWCCKAIRKVGA